MNLHFFVLPCLVVVSRAHPEHLSASTTAYQQNGLVNKVIDRMVEVPLRHTADLDSAVLGKVKTPQASTLRGLKSPPPPSAEPGRTSQSLQPVPLPPAQSLSLGELIRRKLKESGWFQKSEHTPIKWINRVSALPCPPVLAAPMPGLLGPAVWQFQHALIHPKDGECSVDFLQVSKIHFLEGLDAFAGALNRLGGNMGNFFLTNTKKFRNSKATMSENDLKTWLLSELPVHQANKYKSYVDDSAWTANQWSAWILEFFVEMFALVQEGKDTKDSAEQAYKQTLSSHHNFILRKAFNFAVGKLPDRQELLEALKGDESTSISQADVLKQLSDFVTVGRLLVKSCLQMDDELTQRLRLEHQAYVMG